MSSPLGRPRAAAPAAGTVCLSAALPPRVLESADPRLVAPGVGGAGCAPGEKEGGGSREPPFPEKKSSCLEFTFHFL